MALQMARPYKHPRYRGYSFRQRVPTGLRGILGDRIVSRSLRTEDPEAAKQRNVDQIRKQAVIWAAQRKRPEPLPHKQIVALCAVFYRDYMAMPEPEPGEPGIWIELQKLLDRVALHALGCDQPEV